MELIAKLFDFVMHLDVHLNSLIVSYQLWTYLILFAVIFCETGLVVTPFLPGDSLLFATGALAATPGSPLKVYWLFLILAAAAVLGDTVNYWIGHLVGPRAFRGENVRFLNRKHLDRTHEFFEKYGGKTIIIARFVPIVRTFAPFVAGIGSMSYGRFFSYNVIGGLVWVFGLVLLGYYFGAIPVVECNFSLVILAIIVISILPGVYEVVRQRREAARARGQRGR